MTDLEIQTWIENNMYHEDGTPMIDVQTFYEGAKWMRNQALSIGAVSQQRELLLDFLSKVNGNLIVHPHLQMNSDFVDDYLKSNNCG